jgi:hypothetical protein
MNIENFPRAYTLGVIILVVAILGTVIAVNPGNLVFKDQTDYDSLRKIAEQEAQAYRDLLASVEPDYVASQQLLEKIATEDIVRQQVIGELNADKPVTIPTIADSEIVVAQRSDRPAMLDYINRLGSMVTNYNDAVMSVAAQTFGDNPDSGAIAGASTQTQTLTQNIRGLPVPVEAKELHKAYITTYDQYGQFLDTAAQNARGENLNPWPQIYGQYAVIDNRLAVASAEYQKLNQKYALHEPEAGNKAASELAASFGLLKTAQAQWAVIDVVQRVIDGLKVGMARAFAKFAIVMLDKLVAHIEKNFAIASQLYYSQDLARFYSVEYMKKFVSDPLDQDIIQKFLPQYFCVNPSGRELRDIFTAKAVANQGADIVLDPNDPQFLTKLARLGGDPRNYPNWHEDYYMALAAKTQAEAQAAASKEVLSPGLKSGRDLVNAQISKAMASVFNVQAAAINGTIQLGTSNSDNIISQLVAGVVESLVNKFVFTAIGAGTGSAGGIGVIAESNVCLRTPKIKPVAAIPTTGSESVPTEPSSTPNPIYPVGSTPPFVPR